MIGSGLFQSLSTRITALKNALLDSAAVGNGAGAIGFLYATAYAGNTVGAWLKGLAANTGAGFIGWVQSGAGAVLRTIAAALADRVTDRDYGTTRNGVASDAAALQAAHDYLEGLAAGGTLEIAPGPALKFIAGDTFTWNPNKVKIRGNGVTWDVSAATTAIASFLKLRQTNNDPNARVAWNRVHPLESVVFLGPGTGTAVVPQVQAFSLADLNPIGGTFTCAGVTLRDCAFVNWWRDVVYGNGAFLTTVDASCNITGGVGYDASHLLPAVVSNGGEHIAIAGFISKPTGTCIRNQNPNSSVFCTASLDYSACLIDAQAGYTSSTRYAENNTDTDNWFKVTGSAVLSLRGQVVVTPWTMQTLAIVGTAGQFTCGAASLVVGNPVTINGAFSSGSITGYVSGAVYYIIATNGSTTFTLSATPGGAAVVTTVGTPSPGASFVLNKAQHEVFYTDVSDTNGGLDVEIVRSFGPFAYPLLLIGGTGRYRYTELANGLAAVHPAIGRGGNLVGNGQFTSGQLTDGALLGTTLPAIVTATTAPSSTKSLQFTGQVGLIAPSWTLNFPCKPQDSFNASVWVKTLLAATGATFNIGLNWLDAGGSSLGGATLFSTAGTNVGPTLALISCQTPAPPGTRSAQLTINIFGTTGGVPTAFISDLIAEIPSR